MISRQAEPETLAPARVPPAGNKRREVRFQMHGFAQVRSVPPLNGRRVPGKILDMSKNGIRLQMRAQFPLGATLHIFLKQILLIGEVRHCEPTGNGFIYGVAVNNSEDQLGA